MSKPDTSPKTPLRIAELTFSGGTTVDCSESDLVVLVGPNNSGKSQTLADVHTLVRQGTTGICVREATLAKEDWPVADEWLRHYYGTKVNADGHNVYLIPGTGHGLRVDRAQRFWRDQNSQELGEAIVKRLDASGRLGLISSPRRPDPRSTEIDADPINIYLARKEVRAEVDRIVKRAFRKVLIPDTWSQSTQLRIADRAVRFNPARDVDGTGMPSEDFIRRLDDCELVTGQGDGIKSFVGALLALHAGRQPVQLIDEPEAFLHPPQAKLLGSEIGRLSSPQRQIFVATHSSDVLSGILDSVKGRRVKIIRITREKPGAVVADIPPVELESLWNDATLRYSRAIEGLFHDGVVLCEAPTDCYFYNAVYESVGDPTPQSDSKDLVFASSNGKRGIAPLGRALNKLSVPWCAIADIDLLASKTDVEKLLDTRSVNVQTKTELEQLRSSIDRAVRGTGTPPKISTVKTAIDKVLPSDLRSALTDELRGKIVAALGPEGSWRTVKQGGRSGIPAKHRASFDKLQGSLDELGILLVIEGELESLGDTIDLHGGEWLREALDQERHLAEPAREILGRVTSYL